MIDLTPRQRVLEILNLNREHGPVLASPLKTPTIGQMQKAGVFYPEALSHPRKMASLASMIYEELGWESLRIPFEITMEAEAFGAQIHLGTKIQEPGVKGPAFRKLEDFDIPGFIFRRSRFRVVFEAIRLLDNKYPDLPLFVQAVGPFTIGSMLFGMEDFLMGLIRFPKQSETVMNYITDFLIEYIRRIYECGDVIVCVGDSVASGDIISFAMFQRFVLPCYQKITGTFKKPMSLHLCGTTHEILKILPETGFRAFAFEGPVVSVDQVRTSCPDEIVRVGNIPTLNVLLYGDPEEVEQESLKALESGVDLLAPACGIPMYTPEKNLIAMRNAVEKFRASRTTG